jgi:hypothetical protein
LGFFFSLFVLESVARKALAPANPLPSNTVGGFFSFFGFRISRLVRRWPFAMGVILCVQE